MHVLVRQTFISIKQRKKVRPTEIKKKNGPMLEVIIHGQVLLFIRIEYGFQSSFLKSGRLYNRTIIYNTVETQKLSIRNSLTTSREGRDETTYQSKKKNLIMTQKFSIYPKSKK